MEKNNIKTLNVMNTLNGHTQHIVNEINGLFNDKRYERLRNAILYALAVRYKEEISNKSDVVINFIPDAVTNQEFLLMNIFDDDDLEIMLNFCYGDYKAVRGSLSNRIVDVVNKCFNGCCVFNTPLNVAFFNKGYLTINKFIMLESVKGGKFHAIDTTTRIRFTFTSPCFPIYELSNILKHLKANAVKTYKLRVTASREIEVKAANIDDARAMVKDIVNGDPLVSADIDDIQRVFSEEEYEFSTNEDDYLRVLDDATCTNKDIYAIHFDETCNTHLFDVLEDEFIAMLDLGLINGDGSYYFLKPLSVEEIKKYRKMFATGFRDIFEKAENKKC